MITKLSHTAIYVLDQNSAHDFYVGKLGFKVHTDAPMGEAGRWLTLTAPDQPKLEITIMPVSESEKMSKETADQFRELIKNGTFGFGVFETHDINATYEELKAKGVEFIKPPTKEFYATEALFKDDSGNWFSLTERQK
ncbi:MAG: VOC family protein [Flavobacteriaceae bacterium]